MNRKHLAVVQLIVVLGLFLSLVQTAFAQGKPGSKRDPQAASKHAESGEAYLKEGDNESALREFRRAHEIGQDPSVLQRVATVYERMDKVQAAIDALDQYLNEAPKARDRIEVQARIQTLKEKQAKLAAKKNVVTSDGEADPKKGKQPVSVRPKRPETSGLALVAGFGYQFAGYGAHLGYYIQFSSDTRLYLYGGAGSYEKMGGGTGGVSLVQGGRHRGVIDINYGLAATETATNQLTGEWTKTSLYGITGGAGYEYMSNFGLIVRPIIGGTYLTDKPMSSDTRVVLTISLGLGYKFF